MRTICARSLCNDLPFTAPAGFCTFEAGFCAWTNQDEGDDFDWKLGRGTRPASPFCEHILIAFFG